MSRNVVRWLEGSLLVALVLLVVRVAAVGAQGGMPNQIYLPLSMSDREAIVKDGSFENGPVGSPWQWEADQPIVHE
ncbi:MAG: hypothetical protein ACRDIB_18155, partial [Ardenticatenaceae bacterium]